MSIIFNVTSREGKAEAVSAFTSNHSFVATAEHPRFAEIVKFFAQSKHLMASEADIALLFDITIAAGAQFEQLSERVSMAYSRIYFDGDPVDDVVTSLLVRFWGEGKAFMPLVNFMEKVAQNPNNHSREQLFGWLSKHNFALAEDGDIIAYKGVNTNDTSATAGQAIVNGKVVKGHIPNPRGAVIEMPRSEVAHDPETACSTGLHAGNYRYASTFAAKTVRVKINPRDVVSVPTDSSGEKMRVCRYRVMEQVTSEDASLLYVGQEVTRIMKPSPAPVSAPKESRARATATVAEAPAPVAKKKAPKRKTKVYYEQCKKADFMAMNREELRWVAKEWGVAVPFPQRKEDFAHKLDYAARGRRSRNKK